MTGTLTLNAYPFAKGQNNKVHFEIRTGGTDARALAIKVTDGGSNEAILFIDPISHTLQVGKAPQAGANDTQLPTTAWVRTFVNSLIGDTGGGVVVPVGALMMGPVGSMAGYLLCDGRAVSRTQYSALFTAIGVNFGAGDGSTTFNIPDYRGCFLRMAGGDAGSIFTKQPQGLPDVPSKVVLSSQQGAYAANGIFQSRVGGQVSHDGYKNWASGYDVALAYANSIYGSANEVRPVNFAVNYFIKY